MGPQGGGAGYGMVPRVNGVAASDAMLASPLVSSDNGKGRRASEERFPRLSMSRIFSYEPHDFVVDGSGAPNESITCHFLGGFAFFVPRTTDCNRRMLRVGVPFFCVAVSRCASLPWESNLAAFAFFEF